MATIVKGKADKAVRALKAALDDYELQHEGAEASLYRQNQASIRLRIIDRHFESMPKSRRHAEVWQFLKARVPEDTIAEVSLVLAVAPAELKMSLANFEYDHPVAANL